MSISAEGKVTRQRLSLLEQWLLRYNSERPHQGYRNLGSRPVETIELYLKEREPLEKSTPQNGRKSGNSVRDDV